MFLIKLFRFFLGYVRFTVTGDFPERFLNLVTHSKLRVWGMKKSGGQLCGYIIAKDYIGMRPFARRSRVRFRTDRKFGLPFFISRYKNRFGFFIGIAVYAAMLFALSSSIWSIEISGNSLVSDREIESALADNGFKIGCRHSGINEHELSQRVIMQVDDISYVTIYIRGSVAQVQVQELKDGAALYDDTPCNVVSLRKGKILSVNAYSGKATVAPGDTVVEGDILISGAVENAEVNHLVPAKGKVTAEVNEEFTFSTSADRNVLKVEKNPYRRRRLNFFSLKIPLFVGRLPSGEYRIFREDGSATLFGRKLPVGFDTEYHYLLKEEKHTFSESEGKRFCNATLALREINTIKKSDIISEQSDFEEKNGKFILRKNCVFRADIGKRVEIGVKNSEEN